MPLFALQLVHSTYARLPVISPLTHTSPPPLHAPENSHVASVPSHSNTRPAQPKAAIRIPSSAGPTHPRVSVPSFMIASRLLAPIGVASAARGVGLGGTSRVGVGQGVANAWELRIADCR